MMIRITDGRGFQMTFANGNMVSVQFGSMNYCSIRSFDFDQSDIYGSAKAAEGSPDAEIAAFDVDGRWLIPTGDLRATLGWGEDDVHGWVSPDHVAMFIAWVASGAPDSGPTMSERWKMDEDDDRALEEDTDHYFSDDEQRNLSLEDGE